jgi:O-antigen/teichoic acid export membrane protein
MGLDRQVIFNCLRIVSVTASNVGAVLVLWRVSSTIQAFLIWQISISAIQAVFIALTLWSFLPGSGRAARFDLSALRGVWRFAVGMSGITLVGLTLTQVDKLLVSKLLPLKIFGYYTLAWAVANGLLTISGAVYNVIFPRMSAQVAAGDQRGLLESYHRGAQLMAVVVLPLAAVLAFFPFDVLQLWTRNAETATFDARILSILVVGSALNSLLYVPYSLQLAYGWTKISLVAGVVSVAIVIPSLFPMIRYFGAVGAASIWAALNILNMMIVVPITHRRILPGAAGHYFRDIGLPLLAVTGIAFLARMIVPESPPPLTLLALVCSIWVAAVIAAILAAPQIRSWVKVQMMSVKLHVSSGGSLG